MRLERGPGLGVRSGEQFAPDHDTESETGHVIEGVLDQAAKGRLGVDTLRTCGVVLVRQSNMKPAVQTPMTMNASLVPVLAGAGHFPEDGGKFGDYRLCKPTAGKTGVVQKAEHSSVG